MSSAPKTDAERVVAAMPAHVGQVCATLAQAGHQAVVVGGCVRDVLLGRMPKDWDVASSAHPEDVMKLFRRVLPTGVSHGTVTVMQGHDGIEVTAFRGDGAYSDGRRPDQVLFGVPLTDDLARRDFTVNAMAVDPAAGELVDPFDGATDLAGRILRAVGDPAARFDEDGLRVMRAVRFAAVLEFDIGADTVAAIPGALDKLRKVSAERVQVELEKLLGAARPRLGLEPAWRTGVLGVVMPELVGREESVERAFDTIDGLPRNADLRLAALLWATAETSGVGTSPPGVTPKGLRNDRAAAFGQDVATRLRLSNTQKQRLADLCGQRALGAPGDWLEPDLRRLMARLGAERAGELFVLAEAWAPSTTRSAWGELRARAKAIVDRRDPLTAKDLAVSGRDLMVLGLNGPAVGKALERLLARVHEDPSHNTKDALLAIATQGEP